MVRKVKRGHLMFVTLDKKGEAKFVGLKVFKNDLVFKERLVIHHKSAFIFYNQM
jgi:hypothetical protein